jgi:hypothetical protein
MQPLYYIPVLPIANTILYDPYKPSDPSTEALVSAGSQHSYQDKDI